MNEKKLIDEVNERLQKASSKFIEEYITKYYKDLVEENERLREDLYDARHMMWTKGEENKKLKEENEKLKKENKRLREIQIYGKTVAERIEYDRKVFRE